METKMNRIKIVVEIDLDENLDEQDAMSRIADKVEELDDEHQRFIDAELME